MSREYCFYETIPRNFQLPFLEQICAYHNNKLEIPRRKQNHPCSFNPNYLLLLKKLKLEKIFVDLGIMVYLIAIKIKTINLYFYQTLFSKVPSLSTFESIFR